MTRMKIDNGHPSRAASSIETPVTPPSMKWLESKNPLSPKLAETMPRHTNTASLIAPRRSNGGACFGDEVAMDVARP